MADRMHTSPGWSPRWVRISLTRSSLRRLRLRTNSMSQPFFRRQPLGILPQPVAERLGEPRVVENADVALVQVRGHALGKADPRQRTEQQDPIPAEKRPCDLGCVAFRQQRQAHSGIIPWSNNLFGSGCAGLGHAEAWREALRCSAANCE